MLEKIIDGAVRLRFQRDAARDRKQAELVDRLATGDPGLTSAKLLEEVDQHALNLSEIQCRTLDEARRRELVEAISKLPECVKERDAAGSHKWEVLAKQQKEALRMRDRHRVERREATMRFDTAVAAVEKIERLKRELADLEVRHADQ